MSTEIKNGECIIRKDGSGDVFPARLTNVMIVGYATNTRSGVYRNIPVSEVRHATSEEVNKTKSGETCKVEGE